MPKEKIRKMTGIFASVFAHTGYISKDDAKEISGLDDRGFKEAYAKASNIADKCMNAESKKMDKFMEHFAEEIEEYMEDYGGNLYK
ncbi:hypothetical protein KA005_35060 [bacterium]|nr:hypothetical protein [bacterium]